MKLSINYISFLTVSNDKGIAAVALLHRNDCFL